MNKLQMVAVAKMYGEEVLGFELKLGLTDEKLMNVVENVLNEGDLKVLAKFEEKIIQLKKLFG